MDTQDELQKQPGESDADYFNRKRREAQQRVLDANGAVLDNGTLYIVAPGLNNISTSTQRTRLE